MEVLVHVKSLSSVFKGKFCDALKLLHKKGDLKQQRPQNEYDFERFLTGLKRKKWVVNSKPGFNGGTSVLEYLGRYTHKIAMSNYRLRSLKDEVVTFSYRGRKAGDIKRIMPLPVKEFVVRFSRHILPSRFVKIRHYGIFSTRNKGIKLSQVRASLGETEVPKPENLRASEVLFVTQGIDVHQCKECKEGKMVVVKLIPSSRGSPHHLPTLDRALLYE